MESKASSNDSSNDLLVDLTKKIVTGNMYPDLGDLVFNGMYHVIEFQEHIYTDDAVSKVVEFLQLLVDIIDQPAVRIKMNCLNVYVHSYHGFNQ
jgi:hypothetical protein